jgi:hypothetical protein
MNDQNQNIKVTAENIIRQARLSAASNPYSLEQYNTRETPAPISRHISRHANHKNCAIIKYVSSYDGKILLRNSFPLHTHTFHQSIAKLRVKCIFDSQELTSEKLLNKHRELPNSNTTLLAIEFNPHLLLTSGRADGFVFGPQSRLPIAGLL